MKRLRPILVLVASATTLLGQGRVNFNNISTAPVLDPIWTYSGLGQSNNVGANFSIQLLWAAGTFANEGLFHAASPTASGPIAFFGVTGGSPFQDGAGLFDGGTIAIGPVGTYTMQAQAWINGGLYPTYVSAFSSGTPYFARSQLFTINVTAPPDGAVDTVFPSFIVYTVPEPGAFAMLGTGLVALWVLRRGR